MPLNSKFIQHSNEHIIFHISTHILTWVLVLKIHPQIYLWSDQKVINKNVVHASTAVGNLGGDCSIRPELWRHTWSLLLIQNASPDSTPLPRSPNGGHGSSKTSLSGPGTIILALREVCTSPLVTLRTKFRNRNQGAEKSSESFSYEIKNGMVYLSKFANCDGVCIEAWEREAEYWANFMMSARDRMHEDPFRLFWNPPDSMALQLQLLCRRMMSYVHFSALECRKRGRIPDVAVCYL